MDQGTLDNLSFAAFTASFRVTSGEPVLLPPYTGSTFHGALGRALSRVSFGRKPACGTCHARSECRYGNLFAYLFQAPADHPFLAANHARLQQIYSSPIQINKVREFPPPYILDPPAGGRYDLDEQFDLTFLLVGRAIEYFPFVVCGLEVMADGWLGGNRQAAIHLEEIRAEDLAGQGTYSIYDPLTSRLAGPGMVFDFDFAADWADTYSRVHGGCRHLGLRFLTPLKFRKQGKVQSDPDFVDFMKTLIRRIVFLSVHSPLSTAIDQHGLLALAEKIESSGRAFDAGYLRRSSKDNGKPDLFGSMGEIFFAGDLEPFLPFIKLGEFLHIGKAPTLGLGKYTILLPGMDS